MTSEKVLPAPVLALWAVSVVALLLVAGVLVFKGDPHQAGAHKADPYAAYLANNPEPGHVISREDAQTRALLGCGQAWAPGTVDAVLHEAYKGLCK